MTATPPDEPKDPLGDPFGRPESSLPPPPSGPPPVPLSAEAEARRRRQRWRHRRRVFGSLVFLAIVIGLGVVVANAMGVGDDDDKKVAQSSTTTPTTTTLPPAGPYKVTDGLNIRTGPGTTYPVIGQIELGFEVTVLCVIDGESVAGPGGATTAWLRIASDAGPAAYVTAAHVLVGADLVNPAVIAVCTGI